jgi:hypothetical protein
MTPPVASMPPLAGAQATPPAASMPPLAGAMFNTASGDYSAIPGGYNLQVGTRSFGFSGQTSAIPTNLSANSNIAAFVDVDLWLYSRDFTTCKPASLLRSTGARERDKLRCAAGADVAFGKHHLHAAGECTGYLRGVATVGQYRSDELAPGTLWNGDGGPAEYRCKYEHHFHSNHRRCAIGRSGLFDAAFDPRGSIDFPRSKCYRSKYCDDTNAECDDSSCQRSRPTMELHGHPTVRVAWSGATG